MKTMNGIAAMLFAASLCTGCTEEPSATQPRQLPIQEVRYVAHEHGHAHGHSGRRVRATDGPHDRTIWAELVQVDEQGRTQGVTRAKVGQDPDGKLCDEQRLDAIDDAGYVLLDRCQHCNENMLRLPGWRCCSEVFGEHAHPEEPIQVRYVVNAR